jgi:type IV pilus assembly protein PilQ
MDNALQDISFSSLPDRGIEVVIEAAGPIVETSSFSTQNPARIAIDFAGMRSQLAQKSQPVGVGLVRSINAVEAQGRTRVVVNLVDSMQYRINVEGNRAILRLGGEAVDEPQVMPLASGDPGGVAGPAAQAPEVTPLASADPGVMADPAASAPGLAPSIDSRPAAEPMAQSTPPAMGMAAGRSLASVDFRRGAEESGKVVFILSDPNTVVDLYEDAGQVSMDFRNTEVPDNLLRKFDVADFGTPVKIFEVTAKGDDVHVGFTSDENYEYLAYQTDNEFTVEFRPLTKEEKEAMIREKVGYTGERLSLNFQDIEVRAVLQLLGDFTGKNMVVADSVTGNITLRLKNVPWDQAMDLILKTRRLGKRVEDNIILIAPASELAAQEEQELASQQKIEELAPLHAEFFQINYAKAADIAALLKSEDNELLTPERGNVTFDERTNMLLVRDTATKLEDLQRLIRRLDVPVQQVLIESRIVIASDSFSRDIGVRLGFSRANKLDGTDVLIGGGLDGGLDGSAAYYTGLFGANVEGLQFPAMVSSGTDAQGLMVNLPGASAGGQGGLLNVLVGKVGSYLLQLELSAMETEGKGQVVSNPRLITADKMQATISQGIQIPYRSSDGDTQNTDFQDANLELDVTPLITPDDRVIMEIKVSNNQPDFALATADGVPINTREINTNVLVNNGETVVLGGVYETQTSESLEKVPFFGDLPVLGNLFRHKNRSVNNSELLIFVTPRILKEDLTMK